MIIILTFIAVICGPVFLFSGFWALLVWNTALKNGYGLKKTIKPIALAVLAIIITFVCSYFIFNNI